MPVSLEKEPGLSQTMAFVEDYCHSFSLFSKITGNFTTLSQTRLDLSHEHYSADLSIIQFLSWCYLMMSCGYPTESHRQNVKQC